MSNLTAWSNESVELMESTAQSISTLQNLSGTNVDNLPLYYICPATLMGKFPSLPTDELQASPEKLFEAGVMKPLDFVDGYPATQEGCPFWERLENEPMEYYNLFKAYREDVYYKNITAPSKNANEIDKNSGRAARSLYTIADRTGVNRKVIMVLSRLWHWHLRAKAYDIFNKQEMEKLKAAEVRRMQNHHADAAQKIFEKCMDYIEKNKHKMDPKTALEWFKTSIELERLSYGLPKDKPAGDADNNQSGPSIQINQQFGDQETQAGSQPNKTSNQADEANQSREERISAILSTLEEAQAIEVEEEDKSNEQPQEQPQEQNGPEDA